ncbi:MULTISPECIES: hypothetical protein [unclassified Pseudomonas]|uniref:hypothetical protein n=1 Tax=unclassified Pseudomonas TaxID=196821 RepID=UPI001179A2FA|nr:MULTISPECIES: hypothetical protein [unclassified Pseudomonas]
MNFEQEVDKGGQLGGFIYAAYCIQDSGILKAHHIFVNCDALYISILWLAQTKSKLLTLE